MRQVSDEQRYLDFTSETSLKVVGEYRRKYALISELLDGNNLILWLVHEDLEKLSTSREGREAKYTTENLFRALLVHQIEGTALRDTVIRISESSTLQTFIRLGSRPVMDFTFLNRCFKAISEQTWKMVNEELAGYATKTQGVDPSEVRVDSTVIETNIHYPTDSSLLWDSWRVLARFLRGVRDEAPVLCPHRFHDKKVKKDFVFVNRYIKSKAKRRQREVSRRFRRLLTNVLRLHGIGEGLRKELAGTGNLTLKALQEELSHSLPLVKQVCEVAERVQFKGQSVPACERIFSIFEEHTELIKRGKARKPVEFGHAIWMAQTHEKFITDYEVMEQKQPDSELLDEITTRHKRLFKTYPDALAADRGFRSRPEEMATIHQRVPTLAVPTRGRSSKPKLDVHWHHFRAGIEGSISVLKRAYRLSVCVYRGFKSFAAAVGMAVFCHNLVSLVPKPSSG